MQQYDFLKFLQRYAFRPVSQINLYNKDLKITVNPIPKSGISQSETGCIVITIHPVYRLVYVPYLQRQTSPLRNNLSFGVQPKRTNGCLVFYGIRQHRR